MWNEIIACNSAKKYLQDSIEENRISHAQLFIGKTGYGTLKMALAYAEKVICNGREDCQKRIENLQHPDLHFTFPTINTENAKALSENYLSEFRQFIKQNPYGDLDDWNDFLEVGNKQGLISVAEMESIIHKLSIKSFEGGYKILIVWNADKLHNDAANKFLKLLEEPPEKTLFILLAENENVLLPTIASRCQSLQFYRLEDELIKQKLEEKQIEENKIPAILHQAEGNWNEAKKLLKHNENQHKYEHLFGLWTRSAFQAKQNPKKLKEIYNWSQEVAGWGRENQKNYLQYCSEVFRQALLKNYGSEELVFMEFKEENLKFDKFSYFIHGNNIEEILHELSEASYHIERNGNAKIVLLDLGIKLTRFIHRKAS